MIFDSGLKGDGFVSFVATDNIKGGRLGGERLAQSLGGKGKVVLLRYAEGHDSTGKREQGFLDAMKANPGIEVVSSNQYVGADVEGAYKKAEAILNDLQEAGRLAGHRRHLRRRTSRRPSRCCACCRTTGGPARSSSSASTRRRTW